MKTLDEVIKAYEMCMNVECKNCPYKILINDEAHVPCDQFEKDADALHYLKEFQGLSKIWNDRLDKEQENPPLDWETLKQMEGKPVWIEGSHGCIWDQKSWALINFTHDGDMYCLVIEPKAGYFCIGEEDYGTDWQAYRKERE